jgi:hypothetical protein
MVDAGADAGKFNLQVTADCRMLRLPCRGAGTGKNEREKAMQHHFVNVAR